MKNAIAAKVKEMARRIYSDKLTYTVDKIMQFHVDSAVETEDVPNTPIYRGGLTPAVTPTLVRPRPAAPVGVVPPTPDDAAGTP